MLSAYRFKVKYDPKSSEQLGRLVGIQRYAHNWAINQLSNNNKLDRKQLSKLWTGHRNRHGLHFLEIHDRYVQMSGIEKAFHAFRAHSKWRFKIRKKAIKAILKNDKTISEENITEHMIIEQLSTRSKVHDNYVNGFDKLYRTKKLNKNVLFLDNYHSFKHEGKNLTIFNRSGNICLELNHAIPNDHLPKGIVAKSFTIIEKTNNAKPKTPNKDRSYRILAYCEVPSAPPVTPDPDDIVGYDLGVVNNVVTSDGVFYNNPMQDNIDKIRKNINALNTKMSSLKKGGIKWRLLNQTKRRLYKTIDKYQKDFEQKTAKEVADKASAIAGEKLKHVGMRGSAKGTVANPGKNVAQKRGLNRALSYARPATMQRTINRAAEKVGKLHDLVDPRYTSQTCSCCETVDKKSRKTQALFLCIACYFSAHADHNAAIVIAQRLRSKLLDNVSLAKNRSASGKASRNGRRRANNVQAGFQLTLIRSD